MVDSPEILASLVLTAFIAGIINSVAGGGTLLTFPALMTAFASFGHAEAEVLANATSTVALVPGSSASAWGYRRYIGETRRWLLLLLGPSIVGGIIGSLLVTRLPASYFAMMVPWLLLTAALLFLFDTLTKRRVPTIQLHPSDQPETRPGTSFKTAAGLIAFQFLVSIYGGYFGAGSGILMLSALAMMGAGNIHQMNTIKTILVMSMNGVSTIVFIAEDKVIWRYALHGPGRHPRGLPGSPARNAY